MKKIATLLMISILVLSQIETVHASETPFLKLESVDLSEDLQKYIFEVAKDYSVSPYLIMAVIERESTYRIEAIGDSGRSFGLMQIQKKEHLDRMERLEVTDLLNPKENILTGTDYLYELFQLREDVYWVLMCYNGGFGYARKNNANPTPYAIEVVSRSCELEEEMNRNELNFRKEKIRRKQNGFITTF